ncbi:MAG: MBL fold metallo-hydrolase [Bradymonadaceae bacterium]
MNGVGNAFSRRHWNTNFLVRKDGFVLAIDCPDSYRRALQDNGFEHDGEPFGVADIDAMLVTHLHGDHVNGLEMVLAYRRYIVEEKLDLYTTVPVASVLWEQRLGVALGRSWNGETYEVLGPDDYYDLTQLKWDETATIGPFDLDLRQTIHHVPTTALRISDGERTLGYSCDTAFDESLIDWLEDADQIIHETSYGPGHTPLHELRELPEALKEKMRLVHIPDDIWELGDEVDLEFAEQGAIYEI